MNKIGIAIKSTSAGSGQPTVINGGDWVKHVVDVRDILKHIPSMASDHTVVVIFMSFTEDACIITVARTVSGRPWDNVSGWVHIPNNMKISGEEVSSVLSKVKNLISASELPEESYLNAEFGKEYGKKRLAARYEASKKDGKYAKRDTLRYTLDELLGENRYQSYYSDYNLIFLVKEVDIVVEAHDISDKPLSSLITFIPPTTREIQDKLGRFVSIRLASGQLFNDALLLNKNQTLHLIAERDGFEPTEFLVTAESDGQVCELPQTVWQKKVFASLFDVRSESGKSLNGKVRISVNDNDISTRPICFSENDLKNAYVVISASGYDTYSAKTNLAFNGVIPITLDRKIEEFKKRIHLKNGSTGEITISGKGINKYESPIKGYVVNDGYLDYMPGNVWVQRLIGFAVAVMLWLVVIFVGWWNSVSFQTTSDFPWIEVVSTESKKNITNTTDNITDSEGGAEIEQTAIIQSEDVTLSAAIKYLDTNETWDEIELEKYPDLKGLYNDLNKMDTYKLAFSWQDKLKDSKSFQKISKVAKRNFEKGWDPKQSPHNPTYNDAEDTKINLTNYTNWLDRNQASQSSNSTTHRSDKNGTSQSTQHNQSSNLINQNDLD
jgi:hypothetical protein